MIKAILLLLLIALTVCTSALGPVPFETVEKGGLSNVDEPGKFVVQSQEDLEALPYHSAALDAVEFSKHTVIAVFQGQFPTGGYSVTITNITESQSSLLVSIEEKTPGPDSVVTQSFTQPYHIVKFRKISKPVKFEAKSLLG